MQDYLRKNSKWILTIFSVFLMMAWLITPSTRNQAEIDKGTHIGTLDGKALTNGSTVEADNTIALLAILHIDATNVLRLDPRHAGLHLYLLLKEAQKYRLGVSQLETQAILDEIGVEDDSVPNSQKSLRYLAIVGNTTAENLRKAVTNLALALKIKHLISPSVSPSLPELQHITAESNTTVDARYLLFDGHFPASDIPAPSDAEIDAQFAKYKGTLPAGLAPVADIKPDDYPFGYQYPDRVKIEYLTFDRDAVRKLARLQPTVDDYNNARKVYDKDPTPYQRKVDPAATAPATQPAQLSYEEAKPQIISKIVEGRVTTEIKRMLAIPEHLSGAAFKSTVDADGYRIPITPNHYVSYAAIADDIEKQFGYRPEVHIGAVAAPVESPMGPAAPATAPSAPQWLNMQQLGALEGIGAANYASQGQSFGTFPELALNVRELHLTTDIKKIKAVYRQLQVGVEGPTLVDEKGNFYIYRIDEASPTHEPASLAEVKAQVVTDLRRKAAFDRFAAEAPKRVDIARAAGIVTLSAQLSMNVHQTATFAPITLQPNRDYTTFYVTDPVICDLGQAPANATIGTFPAFSNEIYRVGASNTLTAATRPNATTRPAGTLFLDDGHPVGMVASKARLQVFIFEVTRFVPPNKQEFEEFRAALASRAVQSSSVRQTRSDLQLLADRLNFVSDVDLTPDDSD